MKTEDYKRFMGQSEVILTGDMTSQYILRFACDSDFACKWYDVSGMTIGDDPLTDLPQGLWSADDTIELTLTVRSRVKDVYPDDDSVEVWNSEGSIVVRRVG